MVIQRPGVRLESLESFLFSLGLGFRRAEVEGGTYVGNSGKVVMYRSTTLMDISSTDIRNRNAEGRSIRFLVPESIRHYIMEKGLYRIHGDSRKGAPLPEDHQGAEGH